SSQKYAETLFQKSNIFHILGTPYLKTHSLPAKSRCQAPLSLFDFFAINKLCWAEQKTWPPIEAARKRPPYNPGNGGAGICFGLCRLSRQRGFWFGKWRNAGRRAPMCC
ncbi:MAG TPA: hypothetical protein VLQ89_05590, partial [Candidatus Binatia bacterium]|nr:hypothetical protein [Candidatus Binatia bacterium]